MDSGKRAIASISFLALLGPAVYLSWVLLYTNPVLDGLPPPRSDSLLIPGTKAPLRTTFTGLAVVDEQLYTLFYFFWDCVSGRAPGLSLFTGAFFSDVAVVYGLLVLEGQRPGNSGRFVSYITVLGLIFQNIIYACTMPVYLALYCWTSPLVRSTRRAAVLPDAVSALTIPLAVFAGLVLPSILASLPAPSVISYEVKQILMAVWQPFPLWVGTVHLVLRTVLPQLLPARHVQRLRARPQTALRTTYTILLVFGLAMRFAALGISTVATLFPSLFRPEYASQLGLWKVMIPVTAVHTRPVSSPAEAMLLLLHWDATIGSGATLAWAVILFAQTNRAVGKPVSELALLAAVPAGTALLGTGACAMAVLWARDEIIFGQDAEKKKL